MLYRLIVLHFATIDSLRYWNHHKIESMGFYKSRQSLLFKAVTNVTPADINVGLLGSLKKVINKVTKAKSCLELVVSLYIAVKQNYICDTSK